MFFSECRIKMNDSLFLYFYTFIARNLLNFNVISGCNLLTMELYFAIYRWKKVGSIIFMNEWKIKGNCKKSYRFRLTLLVTVNIVSIFTFLIIYDICTMILSSRVTESQCGSWDKNMIPHIYIYTTRHVHG